MKPITRIHILGILIILNNFFAIVGCDKSSKTAAPPATGKFRVAMILPGSENDKGWNQMAREGLDRIRAELGAETKIVTNVKTGEFATQINYFAGEGFDVVICHGGEFQEPVARAAQQYPKV